MRTPKTLVGLGQGLRFPESPRWHEGRLWFIDIHGNAIKSVSLDGDLRTELELAFKPNGLGFMPDGSAAGMAARCVITPALRGRWSSA
jgi:sugar lactone lactonase YvrE